MSDALDICIQQLKRSALLGLGPQVSIRQVIETETRVRNGSVSSSSTGGELRNAKCLESLSLTDSENEYLLFVHDVCDSFHKRNNTVRSRSSIHVCCLQSSC
jgi:hypothetical protein